MQGARNSHVASAVGGVPGVDSRDKLEAEGAVHPHRSFVLRSVSPALFAAILLAFALPFGTVSCEGPPVTFTGYELATWRVQQTSPPALTDRGKSLPAEIERRSSVVTLIMLLSAVLGLVLGLADRRGAGVAAAIGLTATILLWGRVVGLFSAEVEPRLGFALATGLYLVLAAWHVALRLLRRWIDAAVTRHRNSFVR
jgi:hypothetical protein